LVFVPPPLRLISVLFRGATAMPWATSLRPAGAADGAAKIPKLACPRASAFFGFRISDFFRISGFGFRIFPRHLDAPLLIQTITSAEIVKNFTNFSCSRTAQALNIRPINEHARLPFGSDVELRRLFFALTKQLTVSGARENIGAFTGPERRAARNGY